MIQSRKIEFGDFQTPDGLAQSVVAFLRESGETADAIVEPTCGRGAFLRAGLKAFPEARSVFAFDINAKYVREALETLDPDDVGKTHLECRDFFEEDWTSFLSGLKGTPLVIGNPPWVTNSAVGALGGRNVPSKSNFQGRNGFEAKTGKANFDISEWMLVKLLEGLHRRPGCVAMLCKTATARKTLRHAWVNGLNVGRCSLHLIDAQKQFGASVDACLLLVHTGMAGQAAVASVYPGLAFVAKLSTLGLVGRDLVADVEDYVRLSEIDGVSYYTWRSGVKHDAAGVMEFEPEGDHLVNALHENCRLEPTYLFPLLKSSDLANGRLVPERQVLVTQRRPSDDTAVVRRTAPKTWAYLEAHASALDCRKSIIYQRRPRFSVFGVGDYTFAPWKVAVSGLYKSCRFQVVGSSEGKPIVLDDTCYFIPCGTQGEARFVCDLLNSSVCQRFLRALVFPDSKRPVTVDVLNRIDLMRVADHLDRGAEAARYLSFAARFEDRQPLLVFEGGASYGARSAKPRRPPRNG